MASRHKCRERALQALYQLDLKQKLSGTERPITPISMETAVTQIIASFPDETTKDPFVKQLVLGVAAQLPAIDQMIGKHAENWKVHRMAAIDRNLLRLAVFELKFAEEKLPLQVAIDEALELGKRYGTDETSGFINGILDSVAKK